MIKANLEGSATLRRFEREAELLGRLQHPSIAQVYEAGAAVTGSATQPFFSMELIEGERVDHYTTQHQLTALQRLELVAKMCDGVHHAHLRGIIHRDLKPANILVDQSGQPKILDFGVAHVTESDRHAFDHTQIGQLIGTTAYISPEQVLADPMELDPRSDVYALGVILYELLAGRLPYSIGENLNEAIHVIREHDPARLSSVNRKYRGDIETMAAKALAKDKARRYQSAAELAADIRRYLKDEPIVARPPSTAYQLQKFARRHKAFAAGLAAVVLVLSVGIVATTWQAVRAGRERDRATLAEAGARQERDRAVQAEATARLERDRANANEQIANRERDRAEGEKNRAVVAERSAHTERDRAVAEQQRADTEAETATAVQDFLGNDLLRMASPLIQTQSRQPKQPPSNPNITVKELLDRAATRMGNRFEQKPLVEAAICETIAETYLEIRQDNQAKKQFERAVDLRRRAQGSSSLAALNVAVRLASVYRYQRLYPEAERLVRQVVEDAREGAR